MFISCEDTKKLIKEKNAQFVDVRSSGEFAMSQLPGSINLPLQEINMAGNGELNKSTPVIVFCQSGQRSQIAVHILLSLGFNNVYNMGSYQSWFQCPD